MKKLLLSALFCLPLFGNAQAYTYGFSGNLTTDGWITTNQSSPAFTGMWNIPSTPSSAFPGGGKTGGDTSLALVNYLSTGTSSTTGTGTISNWLISPTRNVKNGDVVRFWSRKGGDGTGTIYPDRLEFRMSTQGNSSVTPSGGSGGLGSYTVVLGTINPTLTTTGYPFEWTQFSYTISGLSGATDCKFAFRYFVTNGGPEGANSDIIAVDDFEIVPTLNNEDFFSSKLNSFPNPVNDFVTISNNENILFNNVIITDINGRNIKSINTNQTSEIQINVSELNTGIYFLKINTNSGAATKKFIKN